MRVFETNKRKRGIELIICGPAIYGGKSSSCGGLDGSFVKLPVWVGSV